MSVGIKTRLSDEKRQYINDLHQIMLKHDGDTTLNIMTGDQTTFVL
jgi:hypothetical protein